MSVDPIDDMRITLYLQSKKIDDLMKDNDDLMRMNSDLKEKNYDFYDRKEFYKAKCPADSRPRRRGPDKRERTRKWRESKNMVRSGEYEIICDKMNKYENMLQDKDRQYEDMLHEKERQYLSLCDKISKYEVNMTQNNRQI